MQLSNPLPSRSVTFLAIALCILTLGCQKSEERVATFPVSGKVLKGGAPINYATIVFHPVNASDTATEKPRGITNPDGTFQLTTYDGNDGAPAGSYQVTIQQWLTEKPEEGPKNRLKEKYSDPKTSPLTATISEGSNDALTFSVD
ncbi:MAG TPA: hypothetical protein DDZ51_14070 [Planctomycetaceae bacterium]|nr:hypothetical protein [Planctomycetaceae bacterium]